MWIVDEERKMIYNGEEGDACVFLRDESEVLFAQTIIELLGEGEKVALCVNEKGIIECACGRARKGLRCFEVDPSWRISKVPYEVERKITPKKGEPQSL